MTSRNLTKYGLIIFIFFHIQVSAFATDLIMVTWNLKDFGKTKDASEIRFIAGLVKNADILAIQEVVAGEGGAQAVARLSDELNRMGAKWDYVVSDPTTGTSHSRERYAFIWKTSKVQLLRTSLATNVESLINREPFLGTFRAGGKTFTIASFHAITRSADPQNEIRYLPDLPLKHPGSPYLFCGDFNLPQSHEVFDLFRKKGYRQALTGQKTSLQSKCSTSECLASEFDNVFYDTKGIGLRAARVEKFHLKFSDHAQALGISDHLPVLFTFSLN